MVTPDPASSAVPRRQLTAGRAERIRTARLQYRRGGRLDPNSVEELEGEESWSVTASEDEDDPHFARLAVHRLPLGCGEDLVLHSDYHLRAEAETVLAVVEHDSLRPCVERRLVRQPDDADRPTILVLDVPSLTDDWLDLGVEELLLTRVLAELQREDDVLVAVQLAAPGDVPRKRREAVRRWKPVFEGIGFRPLRQRDPDLPDDVWLLADWGLLHDADQGLREHFGFAPSPFSHHVPLPPR